MNIEKITLAGQRVRLEPLSATHLPGLARAIADGDLWAIPFTFVPHPDHLPGFLLDAEQAFEQGRDLAFATVDAASGTVVGSTRFRCIEATHRRLEIGFTFLAKSAQRSPINTEAKFLMLAHAFEVWGCNRVELLTDELNEASRNAIARIGAREEGLLRQHMVMRDGRVRNTVVYSVVKAEWPEVKQALQGRMSCPR